MCTQKKIDRVLDMDADLYVLPECANRHLVMLPDGYNMIWTGDDEIPQKGLGVIWKKELSVSVVVDYRKIRHHLPLMVQCYDRQLFVLACWPTIRKETKSYPQLLLEAMREYGQYFDRYPALAMGDFNCFIGQGGVRKSTGTFQDCIKLFETHGMKSAYHELSGEEFGKESEPTFFWRFKEDSRFFIDYTFTNTPLLSYSIGPWEKEISDHRPQIIEL